MSEESWRMFRQTLKNMYNTLIWLLFELFCSPLDPSVFWFKENFFFFAPSYSRSGPKPYLRHTIQLLYGVHHQEPLQICARSAGTWQSQWSCRKRLRDPKLGKILWWPYSESRREAVRIPLCLWNVCDLCNIWVFLRYCWQKVDLWNPSVT